VLFWLENKIKPKPQPLIQTFTQAAARSPSISELPSEFVLLTFAGFRLSVQWFVVCFGFGPFNGFGHYDYVCEISLKNSMFSANRAK
jgi:hypothetical protein